MSFGDLTTPEGLKKLDDFLVDHSYLAGWVPSQVDASTFHEVEKNGGADKFTHVLRWFNHIKSFSEEERVRFPSGEATHKGDEPKACTKAAEPKEEKKGDEGDDEMGDDLFDVDEEEVEREKKRRQDELDEKKKSGKPELIAKSNLILDVKPWEDTTDIKAIEDHVRAIELDGLVWGPSKLAEVAFGVKKLQISCVIEDEKVITEDIEDKIMAAEDLVQSVDVAAFTKV